MVEIKKEDFFVLISEEMKEAVNVAEKIQIPLVHEGIFACFCVEGKTYTHIASNLTASENAIMICEILERVKWILNQKPEIKLATQILINLKKKDGSLNDNPL